MALFHTYATKFIKLLIATSKEKTFKEKLPLSKNKVKKKRKETKKQIHILSNPGRLKSQLDQSIEFCPSLLRYILAKSI